MLYPPIIANRYALISLYPCLYGHISYSNTFGQRQKVICWLSITYLLHDGTLWPMHLFSNFVWRLVIPPPRLTNEFSQSICYDRRKLIWCLQNVILINKSSFNPQFPSGSSTSCEQVFGSCYQSSFF